MTVAAAGGMSLVRAVVLPPWSRTHPVMLAVGGTALFVLFLGGLILGPGVRSNRPRLNLAVTVEKDVGHQLAGELLEHPSRLGKLSRDSAAWAIGLRQGDQVKSVAIHPNHLEVRIERTGTLIVLDVGMLQAPATAAR